jgi:hypothetical protein
MPAGSRLAMAPVHHAHTASVPGEHGRRRGRVAPSRVVASTRFGEEVPEVKALLPSVLCVGEVVAYTGEPRTPTPRPCGRAWSSC